MDEVFDAVEDGDVPWLLEVLDDGVDDISPFQANYFCTFFPSFFLFSFFLFSFFVFICFIFDCRCGFCCCCVWM